MKIFKNLCKRAAALVLAAVIFSTSAIPAGAEISDYWLGYYYCDTDPSYLLFIPTKTTSTFRGEYFWHEHGGGTYAGSNANPSMMYVSGLESRDNLHIEYRQYAKLFGDSFISQSGTLVLYGTISVERIEIARSSVGNYAYYYK